MYSWEIEQLLRLRNYLLDVKEYLDICQGSPQITRIHYDCFNDDFTIDTDDRYQFKFKVKRKD